VPVEISALALRDGQKITGYASIMRDITVRKRAEEALRESEDKFRSIFEQAIDGIMIADAETKRQIEVNESMCIMLGYSRDEIVGLSVDDVHPKEDLPAVRSLFEKQLRGDISLATEVPMLRKDGSVFYADINATHVTLGGKQCLVGVFRDITKRKKADTALREREKQLAASQRIAHVGSWAHNLTTGQVVWSDELFRLLGLDPKTDPADFKMFFDMIHPEDRPALKKAIDETVQTGKHFSIDYRFNLRDGRTRILHAQAELIRDESGTQIILSGTGQDITEHKLAEEKIRRSEEFIRSILDTVDEGFIVIDRDFRILTANNAYCGQVGESCDSVIGRHCYEISHKTLRPCYEEGEECAVRQVFETGEPHTALHKHPDAKGSILYVETKAFPIKDSTGAVTSVIETVNNITEKHLLEEEQLKTQKLEAIGTLAGGIAHDFNNLLQGVFGYISMAKMTMNQKERSLAMLEQAEKALHMSVNLTTQLLTFSKGGRPVKKKIQLKSVIENSVRFALSGSNVDFRIKFDDNLWAVDGDEGQIGQVVQNIVLNADQAMPAGGTIVIAARNVRAPHKGLPVLLAEGQYVEISVKDYGIGIPEQYLSRLFDPYFTTKEKGSGLGLATSYSIIKNHGGLIDVKSELGKGSTFFVYLPAIEAEEEKVGTIPATVKDVRKGRILVMDDEELIRNIVGIMLRALGHEVEFAENCEKAIAKYREALSSGRRFDIVILDLTIRGGMGGEETLRELIALDPEVKAVVSSGYSDNATISEYESRGFRACLVKPYEVAALRDVLNVLLK
jgi:PAS domain S-box-containing protein